MTAGASPLLKPMRALRTETSARGTGQVLVAQPFEEGRRAYSPSRGILSPLPWKPEHVAKLAQLSPPPHSPPPHSPPFDRPDASTGLSLRFRGPALRMAGLSPTSVEASTSAQAAELAAEGSGLSRWSLGQAGKSAGSILASVPFRKSPTKPEEGSYQQMRSPSCAGEAASFAGSTTQRPAPPEPVSGSRRTEADATLKDRLAMLAHSQKAMPWVSSMTIGPGVVYSGFVDKEGFPDLVGSFKYFAQIGKDEEEVVNRPDRFRFHIQTQHELDQHNQSGWQSGRPLDFTKYARHTVHSFASLPSVLAHNVRVQRNPCTGSAAAVYIGEVRKGRRHGLGRIKFASGSEFAGTWVRDQIQGAGVKRRDVNTRYYGCINRGRFHGHGLLIERHKGGYAGFRTTEGLFTDGRRDICGVVGHMRPDRFQINRDLFVTFHLDHVLATEAFDPGMRPRHKYFVKEVEDVFDTAVDSELGANFMANMILQLDNIALDLAAAQVHHTLEAAQNVHVFRHEHSQQLKFEFTQLVVAGKYTKVLRDALFNLVHNYACNIGIFRPQLSLFEAKMASQFRCDASPNTLPAAGDHNGPMANQVKLQLHLRDEFEPLAASRPFALAFERQICRDIATAVDVPVDRLTVFSTCAGDRLSDALSQSSIMSLLILGAEFGPTPMEVACRISAQAGLAHTSLSLGICTRNITKCSIVEIDNSGPHAPATSVTSPTSILHSAESSGSKYVFRPCSTFGKMRCSIRADCKNRVCQNSEERDARVWNEDPQVPISLSQLSMDNDDELNREGALLDRAERRLAEISPTTGHDGVPSGEDSELVQSLMQKRRTLKSLLTADFSDTSASSLIASGQQEMMLATTPATSPHERPGNQTLFGHGGADRGAGVQARGLDV